jgi:hypothetical protein
MQVLNVISIHGGIIDTIQSFVVHNQDEHPNPPIVEAEKVFEEEIKRHGFEIEDEEIETAIENGSWDDNNGHEILLTWSTTVNE